MSDNSNYEIRIYDNKNDKYIYNKRLTIREAIRMFWSGTIQLPKEELLNIEA